MEKECAKIPEIENNLLNINTELKKNLRNDLPTAKQRHKSQN